MYSQTRDELREMTDFSAFEELCNLLLARIGYEGIDPQGIQGRDGGKDSMLWQDDPVVFHYSLRDDWEDKLDEDLETVRAKVTDGAFECEQFVFVTNNMEISGEKKGKKRNEVEETYGWEFELIDGHRIQTELDSHHLDLRKRFLGIPDDAGPEQRLLNEVTQFREERLRRIGQNDQLPVNFQYSPAVVVHIIPRRSLRDQCEFSVSREDVLWPLSVSGMNHRPTAEGIAGFVPSREESGVEAYTNLYRDGRVESVRAIPVNEIDGRKVFSPKYFEGAIYEQLSDYFETLSENGVEPPAHVCISLLGVDGYGIALGGWRGGRDPNKTFNTSRLTPDPVEVTDFTDDPEEMLEKPVTRIWNDAGYMGSMYGR